MANFKFTNSKITGMSSVYGDIKINIDDEIKYYNNDINQLNKLKKMIGFESRYVASKSGTTADMALLAAKNLLESMSYSAQDIDSIIFVTQSPDYNMPGNAHIIHKALNCSKNCIAIDLEYGCSGFVYGLFQANLLIQAGCNKVLLLTGDTLSKIIDVRNRADAPVFGDGAAACIVEKTFETNDTYFTLYSDGSGYDMMWQQAGGYRIPVSDETKKEIRDEKGNIRTIENFYMNGFDVFNFTLSEQPKLLKDILEFSNKTKEDIDYFIMHQANKYIIETIIKKSNIDLLKAPLKTFSDFGNQSSASIPNTICNELSDKIQNRCTVLMQGYGIGLSWGACVTNLENTVCLKPEIYRGEY